MRGTVIREMVYRAKYDLGVHTHTHTHTHIHTHTHTHTSDWDPTHPMCLVLSLGTTTRSSASSCLNVGRASGSSCQHLPMIVKISAGQPLGHLRKRERDMFDIQHKYGLFRSSSSTSFSASLTVSMQVANKQSRHTTVTYKRHVSKQSRHTTVT